MTTKTPAGVTRAGVFRSGAARSASRPLGPDRVPWRRRGREHTACAPPDASPTRIHSHFQYLVPIFGPPACFDPDRGADFFSRSGSMRRLC